MTRSKTLAAPVFEGVGVHSGKHVRPAFFRLRPPGIVFRAGRIWIIAELLLDRRPGRLLEQHDPGRRPFPRPDRRASPLAALWVPGIDSPTIELDGMRSRSWTAAPSRSPASLQTAGIERPVRFPALLEDRPAVHPRRRGSNDRLRPPIEDGGLELSYTIDYPHPAIGGQTLRRPIRWGVFVREIAPARTFGFLKDAESLRSRGLALGASAENSILLDDDSVTNGPLRFPDEFVRHKLLDLIGDLALLGRPLAGRVSAVKAGHRLHFAAVRHLLDHPELTVLGE